MIPNGRAEEINKKEEEFLENLRNGNIKLTPEQIERVKAELASVQSDTTWREKNA